MYLRVQQQKIFKCCIQIKYQFSIFKKKIILITYNFLFKSELQFSTFVGSLIYHKHYHIGVKKVYNLYKIKVGNKACKKKTFSKSNMNEHEILCMYLEFIITHRHLVQSNLKPDRH